ncbi:MAG: hypothetical protein KDB88_01595, partial [Flavobacteriales bacterium]|nr:hypothetical protein [Flavobacteriales bacterium]
MLRTLLGYGLVVPLTLSATHNNGGEILYEHLSGTSYLIRIRTYTDVSSPADRPYLTLLDGDTVPRTSIQFYPGNECGEIQRNEYTIERTFPGPGTYLLEVEDPNRSSALMNISNADQEALFLQAVLVIDPMLGPNTSAVFTSTPLDVSWQWGVLHHDLAAWDADGDSLSYELVPSVGTGGQLIVGYLYPHEIVPGPNNWSWVDADGVFHWDRPQVAGRYNISIRCSEWRNGMLIGQTTRDMDLCAAPQLILSVPDHATAAGLEIRILDFPGSYRLVADDLIGNEQVQVVAGHGGVVHQEALRTD